MNLVDLVHRTLTDLYNKNRNKRYYVSLEVCLYLKELCKEDLIKLGYNLESFSHFVLDKEILDLLGDNNGKPFRVQKEVAEGGTYFCYYWIP